MSARPAQYLEGLIPATASIHDAMRSLELSSLEICLVVDDVRRLLGTVTDGDIRRALVGGATLNSPVHDVMQRNFTFVSPSSGRAEVLELMTALRISQVPILDGRGRLEGLHTLRDIVGAHVRPNVAVVMAGGRGARLGPLTDATPKPMLRVAGRPILERIVLSLVGFGIRRVFLAINYLGHLVEDHFGDGERFGCNIGYLRENRPLGTGGALSLLPHPVEHAVVVMNGDLVTQANIGLMLDFHTEGRQAATVATRRYMHTVPFGCLETEGDRVVRLEEKPTLSHIINAGIYVLEPSVLKHVRPKEEMTLPAIIELCLARGETVRTFEVDDDWLDVGQHEQLRRARGELV